MCYLDDLEQLFIAPRNMRVNYAVACSVSGISGSELIYRILDEMEGDARQMILSHKISCHHCNIRRNNR